MHRTYRDHRPEMPEVALRQARRMASCAQHERAPPAASPCGSLSTRFCGAARRAPEHVPHVGQWAAPSAGANGTAGSSGRRASRATDGVTVAPPAGEGIPRPPPHVTGRRPIGPTRRALLREVCVWPTSTLGHARGRRAVHGHALPPIRRASALSGSPANGPARLRPTRAGATSSAPTHARRPGPTYRRRWQGRHLSVGVKEENAVAGPLAARPAPGTRRSALGRTALYRPTVVACDEEYGWPEPPDGCGPPRARISSNGLGQRSINTAQQRGDLSAGHRYAPRWRRVYAGGLAANQPPPEPVASSNCDGMKLQTFFGRADLAIHSNSPRARLGLTSIV